MCGTKTKLKFDYQTLNLILVKACINNVNTHPAESYIHRALNLFVCFVALRPESTAMLMAGRSVHLTKSKHEQSVNQYLVHILSLVTDKILLE